MINVPREIESERRQTFRRVLDGIPDRYLVALLDGLEHADVVVPGRLFAGEAGGCVVGVTLRTLHPELRWENPRRAKRARSVVDVARDLAKRVGRLGALEQVFDRSVHMVRAQNPGARCNVCARVVADWLEDEARAELARRRATPAQQPTLSHKIDSLADEVRLSLASELSAALAASFGSTRAAAASPMPPARAAAARGRVADPA